jgi:fluoroquinolone transport system permease protein
MRRLAATLRRDLLLQYRYKLIAVSLFMVLFWGGLLALVPEGLRPEPRVIVPAFMVVNMMSTTFYFICGLVLFEKGEAVLMALVTTPLREREYLLSKVLSLTLLACFESFGIVVLFFGVRADWGPLIAGSLLLGSIYTLLGFVAVARYDSINEFLMPSLVLTTGLLLPLAAHFGVLSRLLVFLHPVEPALVLMRAAYAPVGGGELAYGLLGAMMWVVVSYQWARHRFNMFIVRAAGT